MAIVRMKDYSENISDFKITRKEILVSVVQENVWSAQYHLSIPASIEDTDRIQVTCFFCAEEAYFLSHDRQILPLSSKVSPPFPAGCILWLQEGRGGPSCLDRMFHSLSGASRCSDYAAVSRVVRLSQYTCSGVLPSSARCGLVWL
jgi:hypothetical protein